MKNKSISNKSPAVSRPSPVCGWRSAVASRGFTLLELLIVISVMMVLMGLLIPAFYKVQNTAKMKQVQIEIKIIGSAIAAYQLQEREFPVANPSPRPTDVVFDGQDGTPDNSEVMDKLNEASPAVLDVHKLRWDDDGNVLDPYGNQYKITLDLNYDGKIGNKYKRYTVEMDDTDE